MPARLDIVVNKRPDLEVEDRLTPEFILWPSRADTPAHVCMGTQYTRMCTRTKQPVFYKSGQFPSSHALNPFFKLCLEVMTDLAFLYFFVSLAFLWVGH